MKKIALVVDVLDWAFDIEAKILKNKLSDYYNIDIFVSKNYDDDLYKILEDTYDCDMIHFFWRKILLQFSTDEFKSHFNSDIEYNNYINNVCSKISTGIYDHLFIDSDNIKLFNDVFNKYCKMYYVCSKKLEDIYNNIDSYPSTWGVIHDTYDNNLYDVSIKHDFCDDFLTIGWVGNSNWNLKYKDFKGFHSILNPVLDELISDGYKIKKHFADKNIKFRSNDEMPKYYSEIDICVIVSTCEGTPRPLIEAMASGVPLITTDVGIVSEVLGPKQKEFIIGSRFDDNDLVIKDNLKNNIIKLYNDRELLKELSNENYMYSINNSIDKLLPLYKKYIDDFLYK